MKELEDSKCEVRKTLDLQFSISDRLNASLEEESGSSSGSSGSNRRAKSLGNFFADAAYAWVSFGPKLVVINVKNGVSIGSWTFRERVSCVAPFPAQPGQIPLLLVGLDNGATRVRDSYGLVCVFDCRTSQVLRAIRTPAGVEQACVISGGADWEDCGDKDNVLGESNGMACLALRNLNHLMVDLRRSTWDSAQVTSFVDESNPAELDFTERGETLSTRHKYNREKHAALNLMNSRLEQYIGFSREEFESSTMYEESLTSSLICSRKIGCLVSGCLGRIIIWQTDGEIKWISSALDESMSITHLGLLEPTDDPRPFCYLWSAHQEETNGGGAPILRMYAMLFERKFTEKGTNSYFNLEGDPSVKFELELDENDRITSLCPVVRESNSEQTESTYKRGEESILLIGMEARAIVFDLNQWYQEQMPHTIGECTNPNAIIANYRTRSNGDVSMDEAIVSCVYVPETLKEFPCNAPAPAEELFFPNALSLEWIELSTTRLTFWITRGLQAELLRGISMAGPVLFIEPTETFNRCLAAGLVSSSSGEFTKRDKDSQRETLLSLCLEQRWSQFLLKCAREWSDGSAAYLFPAFLRWGMQRASTIKLAVDRLAEPLYDQSGTSIGEAEVKQLRFYSQQLECIASVVTNLEIDGVDLTNERRTLRRVSTYLQVLLWFYDVGLLPESQELEDEATLPISFSLKIPYPYERLASIYREKRQEFAKHSTKNTAEQEEDMFIDELVTRECSMLKTQWEREAGDSSNNGYYPPSSLQSLLRSFLTDCQNSSDASEMENKHQITIYLLMDLAMLLQNSCPGVNQLIKYPSAFKLSPSFIKLTQAFWLLDHEDYHGFLDMMTGQLVSDSDVKDWHHKLVMRTLIRRNENKLALIYLRVRKPPLSSMDDQSTAISLSVGHGLVQSAFHRRPPSHYAQLLTSFYRACKKYDRLHDVLHLVLDPEEEQVFVKFLENEKSEDDTRLLYYLQRCRYAEAGNVFPLGSGTSARINYQRNNDRSVPLTIFNAYNATLPDITRKFSANVSSKNSNVESPSRYPRPMSHCKSRLKSRDMHEIVTRKARETFLHRDRSRIPFVSAPCVHFDSQTNNLDTNSVLFVERVKKPRGKRSLDDMRGDASPSLDQNDPRKRRKLEESSGSVTTKREIGSSMVFDTPMVKRKNQTVSARNTPIETPHSILKIRQLIRESTSPCPTDGASKNLVELKIHERERKRRQIRFSLGQQAPSLDDVVPNDQENHSNLEKDDSCDEHQEENYFSPNATAKSLYEPTLLDPSTDVSDSDSMNLSGPRPRPSLRKNNESSSSQLLKRTLKKVSNDSSLKTPSETSLSLPDSSANHRTSIAPAHDVFSETMYTESILSSDTSFERTLPPVWPFPEVSSSSEEAAEDPSTSPPRSPQKTHHFHSFTQTVTKTFTSRKSNVFEELTNDCDDDKNSEVLMEVDGFGLDRESTNQSPVKKSIGDLDNAKGSALENAKETTSTLDQEYSQQEFQRENETNAIQDQEMEQSESLASESLELRSLQQRNVQDEEKFEEKDGETEISEDLENPERELAKSSDDYDDELLALRYEEDDDEENDEVFQSLSNSLDVGSARSKLSLERSIVPSDRDDQAIVEKSSSNPSNNNGFYELQKISSEETNITDDESSCSDDESAAIPNSAATDLDKTVSVEILETAFINEASNITNDESSSSFDSAMFTVQKPSQSFTKKSILYEEENKITFDDDDTSGDSAIFSSQKPRVSTETEKVVDWVKESENPSEDEAPQVSSRVKRGKESISAKSATPKKSASPIVETEILTPLRMTRSRRASMAAAQEQSPMIESPITRSTSAGRPRRASSLAKDLFSSAMEIATPTTPIKPEPKSTRLRRSVSLAKELTPVQTRTIEEIPSQEEIPIGRRTRRAASVQKEIPLPAKSKIKKSTSKLSLPEDVVPEEPTRKTRAKKTASTSKDEETSTAPKRFTRASSLAKETEDKDDDVSASLPKRNTRKRGNSVPKDETLETSVKSSLPRSRRGASVAKELVPEELPEQVEKSRKRRATSRSKETANLEKAASWSSTTSTLHPRLSSITAIPEEEDTSKEDEESDEEIFTSRPKSTENTKNTRLRRAASIDSSLIGVKRRTRTTSVQSSIIDEPIEEEEIQDFSETKTKLAKKAPVRRKRTTSVTTSRDNIHENEPDKLPPRRTRKLSQRSNDGDTFRFSPPGKVIHRPGDGRTDEKGDTEVPEYVFSPPHTRSKCITPPPCRKVEHVIQ